MGLLIDDTAGAPFTLQTVGSGDGRRLAVREYGPRRAPTILCLTGLTRNAKDFHPLASTLCDRFRVISFDYRGRGQSEWDDDIKNYDPRTNIGDIGHVLTAMDVEHCAVIGTSLGGLLGFAMGIAMPTRIVGLMINDVAPVVSDAAVGSIKGFLQNPPLHESWDSVVNDLRTHFPDLPAEDEQDWMVIARSTFRERHDGKLEPDWDPKIGQLLDGPAANPDELWPMFDSLRNRPVALVQGERSKFVTPEIAEAMASRRESLPRTVIEGVGHTPSLMEPNARALIDAWLIDCFG